MDNVLSDKRQTFVEEYLIDLNAAQAAIRAGYSDKCAAVTGCRLLSDANVSLAIARAKAERSKRTHVSQDKIVRELARLSFFDIRKLYNEKGVLIPIHELDDDTAAAICGVDVVSVGGEDFVDTKKIKIIDKKGSLELLGRHLVMFTDKKEVTGPGGNPIELQVLSPELSEIAGKYERKD